jgi:hypothetical protein
VERFASDQVDPTRIARIGKIKHIFPSVSPFSLRVTSRLYGKLSVLHQETLRISTVITPAEVIKNIIRHLKLAADAPPIAPAR